MSGELLLGSPGLLAHGAQGDHRVVAVLERREVVGGLALDLGRAERGGAHVQGGSSWSPRDTNFGAWVVTPRLFATASHESPASSRLMAPCAASAASSAPRCFFRACDDLGPDLVERLLLRHLVVDRPQHDAPSLVDLDDRAQMPVEHVGAECSLR